MKKGRGNSRGISEMEVSVDCKWWKKRLIGKLLCTGFNFNVLKL